MSSNRDLPCKDRVFDQMQEREDDIARLYQLIDHGSEDGTGEDYDDAVDALDNLPLSIDQRIVVTILLSWGGPADSIEVEINRLSAMPGDYEILRATYHFADWFDHAELPIPEGSALERYLTDTIESYMESNQVR